MISQHIFYYFTGGRVWLSHVFASSPSPPTPTRPVVSFLLSHIHLYMLSGFQPPHPTPPSFSLSLSLIHTCTLPSSSLHCSVSATSAPPVMRLSTGAVPFNHSAQRVALSLVTSSCCLNSAMLGGGFDRCLPAAQCVSLKITPHSGLLAIF